MTIARTMNLNRVGDGFLEPNCGHGVRVGACEKLWSREEPTEQRAKKVLDVRPFDYGSSERGILRFGEFREFGRVVQRH
jgi:hypothetical protein